ncbi:MAG: hypothetical protein ACLGIK_00290 [Gemmatimonadota bacterium]
MERPSHHASLRVILLAAAAFVHVACTAKPTSEQASVATELVVRPGAVLLRAGETVQLAAQVNDARGRPVGDAAIAFSAAANSIVRVSNQGLVSAAGVAGRDSILVSSGALVRRIAVTVNAGHPAVIEVAAGADQAGVAGSVVSEPLAFIVRDAYGNAIPRIPVRFVAGSGGAASPEAVKTDASGTARVLWTLGSLAGTQSLVVMADSATITVEAMAHAGTMARVVNIDPVARRTSAGDTILVRLRALDAFGNGVEGTAVAFSVSAGGGEVAPARIESDSTGLAEARWRTGTVAGVNVLHVRAFQVHDTTFQIGIRTIGGPPSALQLVSGDGQRARAGVSVRRPPVIRVVDRFGNPVSAVRVRFSTPSLGAVVQPLEVVTDDEGVAGPRVWTLGTSGEQQLLIVADGVPDTLRVRARVTSR